MSIHENVGEISISPKGALWTLSDFSSLPQISNTEIVSPTFTYGNRLWRLWALPNGHSYLSSFCWFGITAINHTDTDELIVELGITNEHREYIVSDRPIRNVRKHYRCQKLISRTDFDSRKNEIMPKGNLHILFRTVSEMEESTVRNETEDGKGSERIPAYVESSTQTEEASGVDRLLQNLKKLLIDEQSSDVILKVEDREFRVHRGILMVRSPVFASMLQPDTKESITGVVDIPDCSAEAFEIFLSYIYTGSVNAISADNVFDLYYVVDKYQTNDLKSDCVEFMEENLSVENFCDIMTLSLQHSETGLQEKATRFFCKNVKLIIKTVQWQKYLKDYSTQANELFIKAINA